MGEEQEVFVDSNIFSYFDRSAPEHEHDQVFKKLDGADEQDPV